MMTRGVGSRQEVGVALCDTHELGNDDLLRPLAPGLSTWYR
jgi:hypothetical protein